MANQEISTQSPNKRHQYDEIDRLFDELGIPAPELGSLALVGAQRSTETAAPKPVDFTAEAVAYFSKSLFPAPLL